MPSPVRRSTRAAQPPPASTTSTSSLSSAKNGRGGANNGKSATPRSLSSEEPSEPPRRSKRARHDEHAVEDPMDNEHNGAEEEEVTRCICGQQEYPGPPQSMAFAGEEGQSDDAGSLFIQCDGCSVWQHGGCVGILEESQSPDKYYCEECRPKQHEVRTDEKGRNYSLYLPLHPKIHRKSSSSKHDEKARKERESVLSRASTEPGKRRATMRSKEHDDEEEQIQRAIEESKRDAEGGNGKKNGKRSRDDSEDSKQDIKRQRRVSESLPSLGRTASLEEESSEEGALNLTASKAKKARAEAALTARNAEMREKEKEREKVRAEAAGRREARAGRRRGDEADGLDDRIKIQPSPPPSSQPSPPPMVSTVPKKGKKTKKLGNNQYTKAKELAAQGNTSSPHSKKRQLATATSGDELTALGENKDSPVHEVSNGNNGKGRWGKGKNKAANGNKHTEEVEKTIPNMKRALDGMQAFITRQQVEMAGNETPPGSEHGPDRAGGMVQAPAMSVPAGSKEFSNLSAMEMADVLSRNIHTWQALYGGIASAT